MPFCLRSTWSNLSLSLVPPPQVVEQDVQEPHSPTSQSTRKQKTNKIFQFSSFLKLTREVASHVAVEGFRQFYDAEFRALFSTFCRFCKQLSGET